MHNTEKMLFPMNAFSDEISNEELTRLLHKFAAKSGSRRELIEAQRLFYNHLGKTLAQHAMQIVRHNEELAAVAVQEAWINIFRTADRYDPTKASVKTWAKMITRQCATDQLRSYYKHHRQSPIVASDGAVSNLDSEHNSQQATGGMDTNFAALDDASALVCPMPHSDDLVYQEQVKKAFRSCLDQLPTANGPNFRQAMELSLDEELSYPDMMEILSVQSQHHANINAEQVRGWVRQARLRMAACLGQKLGWTQNGGKP